MVLCQRCSWTSSLGCPWTLASHATTRTQSDSLRIRPRSVTWYHSPSMLMYLPRLAPNAEGSDVQEPDCEVPPRSRAQGFDLVQG